MNRHDTLLLSCSSLEHRKILRDVLRESYNLLEASNVLQTALLLQQNSACIAAVVLDLSAPESGDLELFTGADTVELIRRIPVIAITRDENPQTVDDIFSLGASDVIPLDYPPYAMVRRIENLVQLHLHKENLEGLVKEQAKALRHSNDVMVDALTSIIEYRSVESGQHILRIRSFTRILLERIAEDCPQYGLTEEIISIISSAAALHDVGKIGIPDSILTKPGPLTEEERELMRTHTTIGCRILESLQDVSNRAYLRYAHNICKYHHERWDGSGYPAGLSGDEIPICAQVVGLADVYDALTTRRVYKEAYEYQIAANMIFRGECGAFSSRLLECFRQELPRLEELSRAYADGLCPNAEEFDIILPEPGPMEDGMEIIQGKFQCLLHYLNAFVLELAVDQGYYHLRYNPYPELGIVTEAVNFQELEQIVLDKLVAPEDRSRMYDLIHTGIREYLQTGMRRQSFRFRLRNAEGGHRLYNLTLLRANVTQTGGRTLAVVCRSLEKIDLPLLREESGDPAFPEMVSSTFCCCNDRNMTLIRMAKGVKTIAGYNRQMLREQFSDRLMELVHPEDRETVLWDIREQLNRGSRIKTEFRVLHRTGQILWVMYEGRLVMEADGRECLYSYVTDISETRRAYDSLARKMERYEVILAQTENALFDWNVEEDTIAFSDTWEDIYGVHPISRNVRRALSHGALLHPDDLPLLIDRICALEGGSDYEMLEVRIAAANGRYLWSRFRASAIRDEQGALKRIVGLVINIDAEKRAEKQLQDRAERDALTKLLNKEAGRRQAEEYLSQFPQGVSGALLLIDLDHFKQVNDHYGHLYGDTVLTQTAREIRKLFRAQDVVARIGGDEFMVLMRGVSDRTLVENRCTRLMQTFLSVFRDIHRKVDFGCSVGIALAPEHGTTYVELFRRADRALYRAKNLGGNNFVFYDGRDPAFLTRSLRDTQTAVSNRIDSDNEPGLADSGLVQYAFRQLYTSRNVDASIAELLALIGRLTNVSRVYVFENSPDNRFCSNTYEWCNEGIAPHLENLQNVSYETDIPGYDRNFDEEDIFCCSDIRSLPAHLYSILDAQGIKSILHCAIRENGVFRGYIGFDDCIAPRPWTREQVELLHYFSEMLSVFLLMMRAREKRERRILELQNLLDQQTASVRIVEKDTFCLRYMNHRTKREYPGARPGMVCYQALMGRPEPCPECPLKREEQTGSFVTGSPSGGRQLVEFGQIPWETRPACLITVHRLPE